VTENRSPVLEPVDRASETIFGVLMAMTFTGALSVATAGKQEIGTLLLTALGCNLGWGLVDAVMYLVDTRVEMDRKINLLRQLHETGDSGKALDLISAALPDRLAAGASPDALEAMRTRFLSVPVPVTALGPRDYLGALGILGLVVLATFPVVIPFLLVSDVALALRLSNLLAICTLLIAGYTLGRSAGGHAWHYGLAMTAIGVALVAIIIALGG